MKRVITEDSDNVYSNYVVHRYDTENVLDIHDEKEEVDVLSTTDNSDDNVAYTHGVSVNSLDEHAHINGGAEYNTSNTNGTLNEHINEVNEGKQN